MKMNRRSKKEDRRSESGTALVTVIMISFLLMIACASLLWAVGGNSKNTSDVLSETKAYYAAESGMQATLNVLRGNVPPSPLIDSTKPASDPANQISYIKATNPTTSNVPAESALAARLSRWVTYNYTPTGAALPDRVIVGDTGTYDPNTGAAYSVTVTDPDNTQGYTTFSTTGAIPQNGTQAYIDFTTGNPAVYTRVSFNPVASTTLTHPAGGAASTSLGTFRVQKFGAGGTMTDTTFQINYSINSPRPQTRIIFGTIKASGVVNFQSAFYTVMGSAISITGLDSSNGLAYTLPGANSFTDIPVNASVTPTQPYRLLLKSTGYGPNGAKKQLEAVIQRNLFNDESGSAAINLIGPAGPNFLWVPGNSNNVSYSGCQPPNPPCTVSVPAIGLTDPSNLAYVTNNPPPSGYQPPPALIGQELPSWQSTPTALNDAVSNLRLAAQQSCCYANVAAGQTPPTTIGYVDASGIGHGLTFIDGDFQYTGTGGGTLVVTGKLTLSGNFSFTGLIVVTGSAGVLRNGGGNGTITGNLVIAPYDPTNLASGFLSPRYQITGGGTSFLVYSGTTTNSFEGTSAASDFVQGVAEK